MTFVFGQFELDPARRELRVKGKAQPLQPQVFDLLLYLVENHERVVPKRELDRLAGGLLAHPNVAVLSDEIYSHQIYDGPPS